MKRRVPFFWWLSAVLLAFCIAYLASLVLSGCQGAQKVASTLELGVVKGDMDLGGPGDEGDLEAVTASFRPLAALEPPQEVRVVEEVPEPVWPQEPAEPLSVSSDPWWRDEGVRQWIERLTALILGALGAVGAQQGYRAYKTRTGSTEE
jgi:hypothetical protein